jgi:hypothetical protein
MSAFGSLADICTAAGHVRFTPKSDIDCVFRHARYGGSRLDEVSFGQPPSLADQNRIVIGFIIADE